MVARPRGPPPPVAPALSAAPWPCAEGSCGTYWAMPGLLHQGVLSMGFYRGPGMSPVFGACSDGVGGRLPSAEGQPGSRAAREGVAQSLPRASNPASNPGAQPGTAACPARCGCRSRGLVGWRQPSSGLAGECVLGLRGDLPSAPSIRCCCSVRSPRRRPTPLSHRDPSPSAERQPPLGWGEGTVYTGIPHCSQLWSGAQQAGREGEGEVCVQWR